MDEDWRNAFGILMCTKICDGTGAGYAMARRRLALVIDVMQALSAFSSAEQ